MDYRRFFHKEPINSDIVKLVGSEFYHCVKVTRHKVGFKIIIVCGDGFDYLCQIQSISDDFLTAFVLEKIVNNTSNKCEITLFQAVAKEMDIIVQKAVELGVSRIVPFYNDFTNVQKFNKERFEKIVLESAKQCGLSKLPIFDDIISFECLLKEVENKRNVLFFYEKEKDNLISNVFKSEEKEVNIIIGSEGGFSTSEAFMLSKIGIQPITLGKRILRAETASIVAVTLVNFLNGEM